jgi:hypothetical protein
MSRLGQKSEWVGQVEGDLLSQLEPTSPLGLDRFGTNGTSGTRFFERPANSAEGCFLCPGIFGRDEEQLPHLSHPLRINGYAALGGTSDLSQTCPRVVPPLLGALESWKLAARGLTPDSLFARVRGLKARFHAGLNCPGGALGGLSGRTCAHGPGMLYPVMLPAILRPCLHLPDHPAPPINNPCALDAGGHGLRTVATLTPEAL